MAQHAPEPLMYANDVAAFLRITGDMARYLLAKELRVVKIGKGTKRRQYATTMSAIAEWQALNLRKADEAHSGNIVPFEQKKRRSKTDELPKGMVLDAKTGKPRIARYSEIFGNVKAK